MKNNSIVDQIIRKASESHLNLSVDELIKHALQNNEGSLTSTGALAADTGEFTGRSPKDKFIVRDSITENTVWWGKINQPISTDKFDSLLEKVIKHYEGKKVYVRDAYACADPKYRMNIGVVTESAYQNLFANNLFLRPSSEEASNQTPDWIILAAPSFLANAEIDGTRQHNFTIVDFSKKIILIGGSGYTGELKKGIFSVLNFTLPEFEKVLSMHCSANIGSQGDTAIFFGLSGTGKTTLSADPDRKLIGDDEHGWAGDSVFNFEGGCYAKCINLTEENEPQIWNAIKKGALVENVRFHENRDVVDYDNTTVTENTRVAYPLDHIDNIAVPSMGKAPKNIFFLTADAFGVLPPISKLTPGQAGYHFISGYTAKVAGTEAGIVDPVAAFSACFGEAFLPLHPAKYAEMLGEKMREHHVNIWLVNTGWSGGPFGIGERMSLKYTRAMITAALNGRLDNVDYEVHPVFGLNMPKTCPEVDSSILNPRNTWDNKNAYDEKANHLAGLFNDNFRKFEEGANEEIKSSAPKSLRTSK
jgi:phosphoenolpyruvate carboxykinase (ATP)